MKIEDIIEGLNRYYESIPNKKDGYFILHKTVDVNPTVKSLKTYKMQVYFKDNKLTTAFLVTLTQRIVTEAEEVKILSHLSILLVETMIKYIHSKEFKELCYVNNE